MFLIYDKLVNFLYLFSDKKYIFVISLFQKDNNKWDFLLRNKYKIYILLGTKKMLRTKKQFFDFIREQKWFF